MNDEIWVFLLFVGLGVSAPMASWGVLSSDAMVFLPVLAFNFLEDALRDALDPKLRK